MNPNLSKWLGKKVDLKIATLLASRTTPSSRSQR
jgi:hypothetical protein